MGYKKSNHGTLWQELERRILHGLSCEWDRAAAELEPPIREQFHKPLFGLKDLKNQWGQWDGRKRLIGLSRNLVRDHSWDAVREVLFHEMSHQLADEVLGSGDETPHGRTFQRACALLRANPAASGTARPLDERVPGKPKRSEDAIMNRIKKLMALAQSDNKHEAEVAMAKAHQILRKHNIELSKEPHYHKYESIFLGRPALRHFREHYYLSALLQDFYFVFCIWVPAYVLEKGKMGNVLEVTGTPQNLKIAGYVYAFVQRFIDTQWNQYNKSKSFTRYRKTDFAVGIIQGFSSKLMSNNTGHTRKKNDPNALVPTGDVQLKEYVRNKYPRIAHIKGRRTRAHQEVLRDGIGIGKKMVISKGIEEKITRHIPLIDKNE
jgi:hypothetical protein